MTDMTHIAFIVPDQSMAEVVKEGWKLHDMVFGQSPDLRYTVDCFISPDAAAEQLEEADIIVSRGGTAAELKARNLLKPVVEIPITTSDISHSARKILKAYGLLPLGIVGARNTIRSALFLKEDFGVPFRTYVTASIALPDLIDGLNKAIDEGCKLILAGRNTKKYCDEHGVPAALIESSPESVFLAIIEAKRCAGVAQIERTNSQIYRGIVNNVSDAIITVDKDNLIRTFNPAAEEFLGRKATACEGQSVRTALPESRLSQILTSSESYTDEIVRIMGDNYVLNSTPLNHDGKRMGMLVTFRSAQSIANAESRLRDRLRAKGYLAKYRFEDIMGESPAIRQAIRQAQRYAGVDSNILLMGETGTGKELFAQSIHNESDRANGPFVAVNCAAIPENLMESELFGYEGGAFTGASKTGKTGLFEAAHEGTIFLDEVSEIPLPLQSRLLRVIQEREVRRVGANRVIPVNVRIVCATNRDLLEMIRQGKFREDLYYRLKVLSVQLPPLRAREGDMALIMQHYLNYYARKFNKGAIALSPEAAQRISDYDWPGNIREIRNVSEQLAVLCDSDTITARDVDDVLPTRSDKHEIRIMRESGGESTLRDLQKQRILAVLSSTGSRKEAAEALGISKTTLWRKCREMGIG